MRRRISRLLLLLALPGCALYSDVSITPLFLTPKNIHRPVSLGEMVEIGDYARAAAQASVVESKQRPSFRELAAVGRAELASSRLASARRHLRRAIDLNPPFLEEGQIAWDLSQTEYLANNYAASLDWANHASRNGMRIIEWHLEYLKALSEVAVYGMPDRAPARVPMTFGDPEIPRIELVANGTEATAVIDSGAVVSIVSETLAQRAAIRRLGTFIGTFYGLLGEPIPVTFGIIEEIRIGALLVRNVPVAIMPDRQLDFLIVNKQTFKMDLLLGANLLKEFRLELSFQDSSMTFTPLSEADRKPAADQNLFFMGFRPVVQTTINRRGWYLFLLDTGSEVTFLNDALLSSTNVRNAPRFHGALLQGLGGSQKRGAKIENVEIGVDHWAGRFRDLPLYGSERTETYGILGQNFLRNFRVILDFGAMRLDLRRDQGPFGNL